LSCVSAKQFKERLEAELGRELRQCGLYVVDAEDKSGGLYIRRRRPKKIVFRIFCSEDMIGLPDPYTGEGPTFSNEKYWKLRKEAEGIVDGVRGVEQIIKYIRQWLPPVRTSLLF
jgi:hypothetical protein